ncbi:MAG: hypothetical protein ACP5NU_01190 [Methanomicrobiales archaeon]
MNQEEEPTKAVAEPDLIPGSSSPAPRTDSDRLQSITEESPDRRNVKSSPGGDDRYRWGNAAEHEARRFLKEQGWDVSLWYRRNPPPDLFAVREGELLVLMVRRTYMRLNTAHQVAIHFGEELARMRSFSPGSSARKECWILVRGDGWRCYEILPRGIRALPGSSTNPAVRDAPEFRNESGRDAPREVASHG